MYVTYANIQNGQQKNGKLLANMAGKTPWNKLCVDLIGPYKICRKGKEPLILKIHNNDRHHNRVV